VHLFAQLAPWVRQCHTARCSPCSLHAICSLYQRGSAPCRIDFHGPDGRAGGRQRDVMKLDQVDSSFLVVVDVDVDRWTTAPTHVAAAAASSWDYCTVDNDFSQLQHQLSLCHIVFYQSPLRQTPRRSFVLCCEFPDASNFLFEALLASARDRSNPKHSRMRNWRH